MKPVSKPLKSGEEVQSPRKPKSRMFKRYDIPRGARAHPSLRLFTWHPRGLLNAALAGQILRFVELEEENSKDPFNRFANLTGLDAVSLSFSEIEAIAARRVGRYDGAAVKTAILALNPLAFGLARIYQQLMKRSPIEVRVFCRIGAAADWLGAPYGVLTEA